MEQTLFTKNDLAFFLNIGSDVAVVRYEGNSLHSLGPWKAKVFWRIAVRQYRVCILDLLLVLWWIMVNRWVEYKLMMSQRRDQIINYSKHINRKVVFIHR